MIAMSEGELERMIRDHAERVERQRRREESKPRLAKETRQARRLRDRQAAK